MKPKTEKIDDKTSYLRCGHVRVRIAKLQRGKYTTHRISWKVGRKGFNRAFNDETAAMLEADRILKNLVNADGAATRVAGADLTYLTECQRRMGSVPLHTAVDFYLKYHEFTDLNPKTFIEVYDMFYERAVQRKLSRRYYETLRHHKNFWVGRFGSRFINTIPPEEYLDYLTNSKYEDRTRKNLFGTLSAILRFARKRRFISESNSEVEAEFGKVRHTTPEIYTPEELMKLFIAHDRRYLPYLAVMAFGGSRRSEASNRKLTENEILFDERMIRLGPEITKTGAGRTLEIGDALMAWLKEFYKEGPIFPMSRTNAPSEDVLKQLGLTLKNNALRHSFCSYHLALHRNSAMTADLAGNSPKILNENYKALVSRNAAELWFCITPEAVREFAKKNNLDRLLTW
jgi:hypothetical protein